MNYTIIRSKRKSIAIYIKKEGTVEARAPYFAAQRIIDAFVKEKADWIEKKLQELDTRKIEAPTLSFEEGSRVQLMGVFYTVVYEDIKQILLTEKQLIIPLKYKNEFQKPLVKLFKAHMAFFINERAKYFAQIMDVRYNNIKINSASTRWGSCSKKGSLNFSWRLIFASPQEVDYVIVHELAHLNQLDHSKLFWDIVARQMPDYLHRRKALSQLAKSIPLADWK